MPPTFYPSYHWLCSVWKKINLFHMLLTSPFPQRRAHVPFQQDGQAWPPLQPPCFPGSRRGGFSPAHLLRHGLKPQQELLFHRVRGGLRPSSYRRDKCCRRPPPEGVHAPLLTLEKDGWRLCCCFVRRLHTPPAHTHVTHKHTAHTHAFFQWPLSAEPAALS